MRSITNARICILFCFLFSGHFFNAQKDLVDSLKSVVTQTPDDTIKVRALNELGWQLLNVKTITGHPLIILIPRYIFRKK